MKRKPLKERLQKLAGIKIPLNEQGYGGLGPPYFWDPTNTFVDANGSWASYESTGVNVNGVWTPNTTYLYGASSNERFSFCTTYGGMYYTGIGDPITSNNYANLSNLANSVPWADVPLCCLYYSDDSPPNPVWPSNYSYAEQFAGPDADSCVHVGNNSIIAAVNFGDPNLGQNYISQGNFNDITLNQIVGACNGDYSGFGNSSLSYLFNCNPSEGDTPENNFACCVIDFLGWEPWGNTITSTSPSQNSMWSTGFLYCTNEYPGCMDPDAENYTSDAVVDDGSCEYINGCTDPNALNFDDAATFDDGSCEYLEGCTDPIALNYDPDAVEDDGSCEYTEGCTDEAAINYDPDAIQDDGSCQYEVICYKCQYPVQSPYGTPGEVVSEIFLINYNPEFANNLGIEPNTYCPEEYEENYKDLDCSGSPLDVVGDESRYRCKIVSINIDGTENGECIQDEEGPFTSIQDCENAGCGERGEKRYKCKIIKMYPDGSSEGECVVSADGPFESLQECEDSKCGEKKKKKKCYKCEGNAPVSYMFDNPPGCPEGWQDTWEDLRCNECEDNPLIDIWLNHPQVISTHCCQSYFITGFPGPQCYENWEEIGGDPNFDPHECCPGPSTDGQQGMPTLDKTNRLKERFQKLAGIKKLKK